MIGPWRTGAACWRVALVAGACSRFPGRPWRPIRTTLHDGHRARAGRHQLHRNTGAGPVNATTPRRAAHFNGAGYCNAREYDPDSGVDMTHTIWGRVTGDGYPITIDTRGSAIDTVVAVYDGVPSARRSSRATTTSGPGPSAHRGRLQHRPGRHVLRPGRLLPRLPAPRTTSASPPGAARPATSAIEALPLRAGRPTPGFTRRRHRAGRRDPRVRRLRRLAHRLAQLQRHRRRDRDVRGRRHVRHA